MTVQGKNARRKLSLLQLAVEVKTSPRHVGSWDTLEPSSTRYDAVISYEGAKRALQRVKKELSFVNESAVRSLEEGLEQTLTLHRLGLFEKVGKSLKTTNSIESIMALIGQKTDKVDHWRNSNQKQRCWLPPFWI
jgi:transposase-like protein